jgi:hypothetical protein
VALLLSTSLYLVFQLAARTFNTMIAICTLLALADSGGLGSGGLVGLTSGGLGLGDYAAVSVFGNGTAAATSLADDKESSVTSDSAMDADNRRHYLFSSGFVLRHFDIDARTFSKQVYVDLDPCTGGGECVAELFWDARRAQLLTVAMGLNNVNTMATLDPATGKLAALPNTSFVSMCGLVEGGAAYDADSQVMYVSLDCYAPGNGTIVGPAIYSFDVSPSASAGMRIVLSGYRSLDDGFPGRLTFGGGELLGFSYDSDSKASTLVGIANNATTPIVGGIAGGIASRTTSVARGKLYAIALFTAAGGGPAVLEVDLASKNLTVLELQLPDGVDIAQLRAY